jgi:HSP20 family protein
MEDKAMFIRYQRVPAVLPHLGAISELERGIDELFDEFLFRSPSPMTSRHPKLDLLEYDDRSVVVAELPGMNQEDIKITMDGEVLTVSGERKSAGVPEGSRWIRNEIGVGRFSRSIQLPHPVEANGVTAELTNGLLRIVLPKAEEAKPREISIRS